jgi:peptidoglycan-associated lipoprotein
MSITLINKKKGATKMKKLLVFLIPLLCIVLMFNTCSKKTAGVQEDKGETPAKVTPAPEQPKPVQKPDTLAKVPAPVVTPPPAEPKPVIADTQKVAAIAEPSLKDELAQCNTVYFDYDRYDLRPDAIATLEKAAKVLKQYPNAIITIEGHCDERGTVEYNLALGERRAHAVKTYLINYGIKPDNLITISYGKERPIDPGHNEEAWAKNRRAVLVPSDSK